MASPTMTVITSFILFVCTFVRSAVGFGDTLLAMPLLGLVMSLQIASPIVAFTGFSIKQRSSLALTKENQVTQSRSVKLVLYPILDIFYSFLTIPNCLYMCV